VNQGSDPVGGRCPLQNKKSSESVGTAGRPSPADLAHPTVCTQMSQRDPFVFRFNIGLLEGQLSQILKLKSSQSTSYLGLNQVNNCRCILNTWRKTAASVGLDLDSSALWAIVWYFGHGFGQGPIKNVFKYSDSDNPDSRPTLVFFFGLGTANDTGRY
jgi:hypothetical protein